MAALVKKDSNYLVAQTREWAKVDTNRDNIVLGILDVDPKSETYGQRLGGLFPWLVAHGVQSSDELLKGFAKNANNPTITEDMIDDMTKAIFEATTPAVAVAMTNMTHDDARLDGSGAGKLAMTKENRTYWKQQPNSKMKDLRKSLSSYLDEGESGGARVTKSLLERIERERLEMVKAVDAAEKDTANPERVTYPVEEESKKLDKLRSLLNQVKTEAERLDKAKVLPTEE